MLRVVRLQHLRHLRRCLCSEAPAVEKPKGNRLQRIWQYFKSILGDYKMVVDETLHDMKERPVKATIYLSLLGGAIYLAKTNPSHASFEQQLLSNNNELLQLSDLIRNPTADRHMQNLNWCYNHGTVRRLNLGVCSLMWYDKFDRDVDLFEAQCKPLKVSWLAVKDRLLDVGVCGRWLWLEKAMVDYDINTDEWPEEAEKQPGKESPKSEGDK